MLSRSATNAELVKLRDRILEDPAALQKWPLVVDHIVPSVADAREIKTKLYRASADYAEAVLQSLQIWFEYDDERPDLESVLRQLNLDGLGEAWQRMLLRLQFRRFREANVLHRDFTLNSNALSYISRRERAALVAIRDLVMESPVALSKWSQVVDHIIPSAADASKIKAALDGASSAFAEGVLQSLQTWHGCGSKRVNLVTVLRQYGMNALARTISAFVSLFFQVKGSKTDTSQAVSHQGLCRPERARTSAQTDAATLHSSAYQKCTEKLNSKGFHLEVPKKKNKAPLTLPPALEPCNLTKQRPSQHPVGKNIRHNGPRCRSGSKQKADSKIKVLLLNITRKNAQPRLEEFQLQWSNPKKVEQNFVGVVSRKLQLRPCHRVRPSIGIGTAFASPRPHLPPRIVMAKRLVERPRFLYGALRLKGQANCSSILAARATRKNPNRIYLLAFS